MEFTLNQIVGFIEDFANQHKFIKAFFFGDIWEYAAKKGDKFTVLTCTLTGAQLSDGRDGTKFQFGLFDMVAQNKSNEKNVLSDTKSIAKDLVSYFHSPVFDDLMIESNIQLTDWSGKTDHDLSGWFFDVLIDQPFQYNVCAIPTTGLPSYPNYNVVTIYNPDTSVNTIIYPGGSFTLSTVATDTADSNTNLSGTTFTLSHTPVFITGVFLNGQRLTLTTDYTVSGTTITFNNALANDIVVVVYSY